MGERKEYQNLTRGDIISVFLYRSGIIFSMLALVYGFLFYFHVITHRTVPSFLSGPNHHIALFLLTFSVVLSTSFLHLYSKTLLKAIRIFALTGLVILIVRYIYFGNDIPSIVFSRGVSGKTGVIGWGFIMAGFSGIGAKEAFCFKLYEGYAYAILSAMFVLLHLAGALSLSAGFIFVTLITGLVVIFTFRKLRLPLFYDIGDKSRY